MLKNIATVAYYTLVVLFFKKLREQLNQDSLEVESSRHEDFLVDDSLTRQQFEKKKILKKLLYDVKN